MQSSNGAFDNYRQSSVDQADPLQLVAMLYSGALRFVNNAIEAVAQQKPEPAHNNILRAYAIISELMATLDHEQGGAISRQLEQCYDYMLYELREADMKKSAAPLQQVARMLSELNETWRLAFSGNAAEGQTAVADAAAGMAAAGSGGSGSGFDLQG